VDISVFIVLLTILFLLTPFFFLKNKHKKNFLMAFLIFFIALSIIFSVPAYENQIKYNDMVEGMNTVPRYLQEYGSKETIVLYDYEDMMSDTGFIYLVRFWSPVEVVYKSTSEDPSGILTESIVKDVDYVMSSKKLSYPCVNCGGYIKLYAPHDSNAYQVPLNDLRFERIDPLYMEWRGDDLLQYISDNATVAIYSDKNQIYSMSFQSRSFYKPRMLEIYCNEDLQEQLIIPSDARIDVSINISLKKGKNTIGFYVPEGGNRPCDIPELNNLDQRLLSLSFSNIKIVPLCGAVVTT